MMFASSRVTIRRVHSEVEFIQVHTYDYKCDRNNYCHYANDLARFKSRRNTRERASPEAGSRRRRRGRGRKKKRNRRGKKKEVERINAHIHATQALARKITVVICGNSGSRLFLRASRRVVRRRVDLSNDRANSLHSIIINGSPYKVSPLEFQSTKLLRFFLEKDKKFSEKYKYTNSADMNIRHKSRKICTNN